MDTEQQPQAFNLVGELTAVGEWNGSTSLPEPERRAVIVPWLAALQNHVDGPLAEAIAGLDSLPDGAAEALTLAGYAVPKET
jgi:hypothetical protein